MRETETKRKREWEADGTEAQITIGGGGGCGVKVSFKKPLALQLGARRAEKASSLTQEPLVPAF